MDELWHEDCWREKRREEEAAFEKRWADEQERRQAVKAIHRQQHLVRKLANISQHLDTYLSLKQSSTMMPWSLSIYALMRMASSGRLVAKKINGKWCILGRSLLGLMQQHIDSGSTPGRCRKRRAHKVEYAQQNHQQASV